LDEYEVRRWRSWQHHIALALRAAFRLTLQQDWGEILPHLTRIQRSRLLSALLPQRHDTLLYPVHWLLTTQGRNARAKRSHHQRRMLRQRERETQEVAA
jgi:hypothetical protein